MKSVQGGSEEIWRGISEKGAIVQCSGGLQCNTVEECSAVQCTAGPSIHLPGITSMAAETPEESSKYTQ